MTPVEQDVFQAAVDLRAVMAQGGLRKVGLFTPPYDDGERLLARALQMTARQVPLTSDREAVERDGLADGRGRLKAEGGLYVTDRRALLMGNFGKLVTTWSWHELSSVSVISGYLGVRFVRPTDTDSSSAALHCYNRRAVLDPSTASVARALVQVEGAYVLGTGADYDAWLVRLQQRFV